MNIHWAILWWEKMNVWHWVKWPAALLNITTITAQTEIGNFDVLLLLEIIRFVFSCTFRGKKIYAKTIRWKWFIWFFLKLFTKWANTFTLWTMKWIWAVKNDHKVMKQSFNGTIDCVAYVKRTEKNSELKLKYIQKMRED